MSILCLESTVKTTETGLEVEGLGNRTQWIICLSCMATHL